MVSVFILVSNDCNIESTILPIAYCVFYHTSIEGDLFGFSTWKARCLINSERDRRVFVLFCLYLLCIFKKFQTNTKLALRLSFLDVMYIV